LWVMFREPTAETQVDWLQIQYVNRLARGTQ
jgi:hypothetical protein